MANLLIKYLIFGALGWCIEIVWTGLNSMARKDARLVSTTSLWMFPIYGLAAFLGPVCVMLSGFPVIVRGAVYVICIYSAEYLTGAFMTRLKACPWDYSRARFNLHGLIRLDYAPLWFMVGLGFEIIHLNL